MKKIVILGNSLTAIKTLETLKSFGEDFEVVVISAENTFPYYRNLVASLAVKKIPQNKIFYRPSTEYESEKIKFIFDKKVTRINFKRRRLTLDDKEQIDYDVLLLSDLLQEPFAPLKGANKSGLYQLKRLSDMTALLKLLPLVETVVVESDHLAGLECALAFCEAKKEVILVTSGKNILNGLLSLEDSLFLETLLAKTSLRIFAENKITEILGDTEAKAIRLQNGKVLGCQAILTDVDWPDLRLFKETELQCGQRVSVNQSYQTNFENVFAMDGVCDTIKIADWDVSQNYLSLVQIYASSIVSKIVGKEFTQTLAEPLTWELKVKDEIIKLSAAGELSQTPILQINREENALVPQPLAA